MDRRWHQHPQCPVPAAFARLVRRGDAGFAEPEVAEDQGAGEPVHSCPFLSRSSWSSRVFLCWASISRIRPSKLPSPLEMDHKALTADPPRVVAASPSPTRAVISTTPMLPAVIVLRLGRGAAHGPNLTRIQRCRGGTAVTRYKAAGNSAKCQAVMAAAKLKFVIVCRKHTGTGKRQSQCAAINTGCSYRVRHAENTTIK